MDYKVGKVIWTGILMVLLCAVFQLTAFADQEDGWDEEHLHYYENGEMVTGWKTIDDETYYFKKADGTMVTGLVEINKQKYYFAEDGIQQFGWITIDEKTYYFEEEDTGWMYKGLKELDGNYYFLDSEGVLQKGCWQTIDGKRYYFRSSDGMAVTGLITISNNNYYFNDEAIMQTGWQTIDNAKYYFKETEKGLGQMVTGAVKIDGVTYYFDENGKKQTNCWMTIDGKKCYYLDETKGFAKGMVTIKGDGTYYFADNGVPQTGWMTINKNKYYFAKSNGKMVTGWVTISNKPYYFNSKGQMLSGWHTLGGAVYYLGASGGSVAKGWQKIGGKQYYFDADGKQQRGFVKIDGSVYYFDASTGVMAGKGFKDIDGARYYFNSTGKMLTGWQTIKKAKYYFNTTTGKMAKGLTRIGSYYYYFSKVGKMAKGKVKISGYTCKFAKPSGKLLNSVKVPANAKGLFTSGGEQVLVTGRGKAKYIKYVKVDNSFEGKMKSAGFPDSYIPYLTALHNKYPNWEFKVYNTGITWSTAVKKQYMFDYSNSAAGISKSYLPSPWYGTKAVSLIYLDEGHPASWFSNEVRSKKWYKGFYKEKQSDGYYYATGCDGDTLTVASKEIIQYYMDPRNFMDPDGNSFFQFLDLSYDSSQTAEAVKKAAVAKGSDWLSKTSYKHKNGDVVNYPSLVYKAGKTAGFNPLALLCLMTQEMGTTLKLSDGSEKPAVSGTATFDVALPGGKVETRKGYYNYFYIGGYADETLGYNAWQRALWYASGMKNPSANTSYGKPWDTRYKAILGGAQYFKQNYLDNGQNTLYTKRFYNAVHQYCTNIDAAWAEGWLLGKAYTEELRTSTNLTFYIPVYKDLPSTPAAQPK